MSIPNRLIFIWFGERLPFTAVLALRSAVRVTRAQQTLLLHRGLRRSSDGVPEALAEPGVELVEADEGWFDDVPEGAVALELFRTLDSPSARANLLRLAALWRLGGVYLDTDTITVRDFDGLRDTAGFCGLEPLVYPATYFEHPTTTRRAGALLRKVLRAGCSRIPLGERCFRLLESLYPTAVNNAVLGSCAGNPLLSEAFVNIARMDSDTRRQRFRLGTHLLQRVTGNCSSPSMAVYPPEYFYPLGPEISIHWFAPGSGKRLQTMVRPDTRVVHWYSSLEHRLRSGPLTREWILGAGSSTAFARLAEPHLD